MKRQFCREKDRFSARDESLVEMTIASLFFDQLEKFLCPFFLMRFSYTIWVWSELKLAV
jgi:hypothetical protein